jgi:hypothetical protein
MIIARRRRRRNVTPQDGNCLPHFSTSYLAGSSKVGVSDKGKRQEGELESGWDSSYSMISVF